MQRLLAFDLRHRRAVQGHQLPVAKGRFGQLRYASPERPGEDSEGQDCGQDGDTLPPPSFRGGTGNICWLRRVSGNLLRNLYIISSDVELRHGVAPEHARTCNDWKVGGNRRRALQMVQATGRAQACHERRARTEPVVRRKRAR